VTLRWRKPSSLVLAAATCLALALASLELPSGPTYDPYAWLAWGRELAHLGLDTNGGGTSWKPLPALVDALLMPFGGAATDSWLVVARGGALFAVFMAYRLAARLAPPRRRVSAGVVAALALMLTQEWLRRNGVGDAEGLMVAFGLLAVDRHLDDRHGQAFALMVAAGLIRVEAWPFVLAYGLWLAARGSGRMRWAIVLGGALIPVLWFGGDWLGSGRLTTAADRALHQVPGSPGATAHPALTVAGEALAMLPAPAWIGVAAAVAFAIRRSRGSGAAAARTSHVLIALAGCAAVWTVIVAAMAQRGYPGLPRFLFMAVGLEAVLAGVGAGHVLDALAFRSPRWTAAAACGLALIGCVPAAARVPTDLAAVDRVADMDARLSRSVLHASRGGRCDYRVRWYEVTALAWDLDTAPGCRCVMSVRRPARPGSGAAGSRLHARPSAHT
jgi:hypothetical protein